MKRREEKRKEEKKREKKKTWENWELIILEA